MTHQNYNGIIEDPRSIEQKALDYKSDDIAGNTPINWIDYNTKTIKNYEIQNQDGSLSCVMQAVAKLLAIHEVFEGRPYTRLCPKFGYDLRANYPEGGMYLPNALSIACNYGLPKETTLPCDNKGETFMNDKSLINQAMFREAEQFKGKFYFSTNFEVNKSIDKIAEVLEQGYGVLLGFRFDYNEWVDVPFLDPNSKKVCGHGVAAVDYVMYGDKKALVIEDSWGPGYGKGGRRIITEEFLKARCFYAGYVTSLPNYTFTKTLKLGSTGLDVKMLQQKIGAVVDGKFGPITKSLVIKFQTSRGLVADGIVGPKTNAELNK